MDRIQIGVVVEDAVVKKVYSNIPGVEVTVVHLDMDGDATFRRASAKDCEQVLSLEHEVWS